MIILSNIVYMENSRGLSPEVPRCLADVIYVTLPAELKLFCAFLLLKKQTTNDVHSGTCSHTAVYHKRALINAIFIFYIIFKLFINLSV